MDLQNIHFPDMWVGQRLYVDGEVNALLLRSFFLVSPGRRLLMLHPIFCLMAAFIQLRKHGLTFVQRSVDGRISLSFRYSLAPYRAAGSLQVEWAFHVLPPFRSNLLLIDQLYGLPMIRQVAKAMATGFLRFTPALVSSPVTFVRYAVLPLTEIARKRDQSYRIRNGYVFITGLPGVSGRILSATGGRMIWRQGMS